MCYRLIFFLTASSLAANISIILSESIQKSNLGNGYYYELYFGIRDYTALDAVYLSALKRKPLNRKINVLMIPWTSLISRRELPLVEKLVPQWQGDTIAVCVHEYYPKILPLLQRLKVTHLFVTQAKKGQRWNNIRILPIPYYPKCTTSPADKKDILYSFVGYDSHLLRKKLFSFARKKKHLSDIVIKERSGWGLHHVGDELGLEYKNVISRSRFGLCPRGASLNTIRLFELMGAGAIPVVLADALYLPPGIDWDKCLIYVKEAQVDKVDAVIRSISLEREQAMRQECLRAYQIFIDDPAYFIRYMLDR